MTVRRFVLLAALVWLLPGPTALLAADGTLAPPAPPALTDAGGQTGGDPAGPEGAGAPTLANAGGQTPGVPAAPAAEAGVPGAAPGPDGTPATAASPAGPAQPQVAPGGEAPTPELAGTPAAPPAEAPLPQPAAVGKPAPDSATEPALEPEPESGHADVSTVELLNEDDRIDHAHEGAGEAGEDGKEDPAARIGSESESTDSDGTAGDGATAEGAGDGAVPEGERIAATEEPGELFPTSPGIEKQKAFWIRIFTHYDSQQGVLHDGRIALPVYEDLELAGRSYRAQRDYVRQRKRELAARLRELAVAVDAGAALDDGQRALLARLPEGSTAAEMREFAENVRFQRGLADRFRQGLIQSGALMEHMREILARHGVPEDLMFLPHVDSSFNNATRSHAGATGIWQFTRGTGRLYMTVGYEVDERQDPIMATEAAARFLRHNHDRLGSWPLAITAYNHGPQSLERITRRMGTRDLAVLIEEYDGRLFKFASKNFYAEFLAAREVAQNYEAYFGPLELHPTLTYREVELPWHVDPAVVADALDIDLSALRRLNPAVRDPVWSGAKYLPPGYALRIPPQAEPQALLAAIPADERHERQKRSLYVRVARGDTLYSIGRRHGIPWQTIALANNISSARRIRPGQKLILPWDGAAPPQSVVDAREAAAEADALAAERVVERIPVRAAAPWRGGLPEDPTRPPAADRFQELRVVRQDPQRKEGEIVAAYGETVGSYSRWAGVTPGEIRRLNDMGRRSVLRPGQTYLIPLDGATAEQFEEQRMAFHREREQSFFAEYEIKEKVKIEVRRGHSPWNLAQQNNVPMWLFYRENPELLSQPLRVGMEVILPVVQAGAR
jgi:membrane-bound lytic murein transglycosylase D